MPDVKALLTSEKEWDEFHREMGKFICAFSNAESFVFSLFSFVSDIPYPKSNAIVGGARLIDMMGIINRLSEQSDHHEETKKEIKELLNQLQHISTYRHVLIHHGGEIQENKISSKNMFSAKTMESIQTWTTDLDNLRAATHDLTTIVLRISILAAPANSPTPLSSVYLFEPWRYKPVQPENLLKQLRPKRQKIARQPRSFRP